MKFILDNLYLFAIALVSGGMLVWPLLKRGGGHAAVSPLEATQLINHRNAIVIDVRDEQVFAGGSVTGARNIPFATLAARIAELTRFKARPAIVVCESGQQSARALAVLKAQGFEETHSLAGGLSAWKQAGLPLVQSNRDVGGRPTQKDVGRNRARSGAKKEVRDEARAYDKARAAAKAASRGAPPSASTLNRRAVLDDANGKSDAVVDPTRLEPANDASTPDRVKEAS